MEPTSGIVLGVRYPESLEVIGIRFLGFQPRVRSLHQERAIRVVRTAGREVGISDRGLEFERRAEKLRQRRYNVALRISRPEGQIIKRLVADRKLWFGGAAEQGVVVVSLGEGEVE